MVSRVGLGWCNWGPFEITGERTCGGKLVWKDPKSGFTRCSRCGCEGPYYHFGNHRDNNWDPPATCTKKLEYRKYEWETSKRVSGWYIHDCGEEFRLEDL